MESTGKLQLIPLNQIRVSGNNPRKVVKPGAVEALAASMKKVGQETPIKVRKLGMRSEELGLNSKIEQPEIPAPQTDLIGSGVRNDGNGCEYELIGGHIRLEAAKSLGWGGLNALVLDVTPQQAELAAILDNQGEDMHWLDWYEAIEKRSKADPEPTQQVIADEFGIDRSTVSRAIKLMGLLNAKARNSICEQLTKSTDCYEIPERVTFPLTDLADPSKIEAALQVVLERKMTEPEARKLVEWVKAGNEPQAFGERDKGIKVENGKECDPHAPLWEGLPKGVKIRQTAQGYVFNWKLSPAEAPVVVYGAMSAFEKLKQEASEGMADERYQTAFPGLLNDAVAVKNAEKAQAALMEAARQEGEKRTKALKEAEKAKKKEMDRKGAHIQRKIKAHEGREILKGEIRAKLDATFGTGMFTESLWQTCLDGQKGQAVKTAASVLSKSHRSPQEQEAFLADFKKSLTRLYRLHQVATASSPPSVTVKEEEAPKDDMAHPEMNSPIPNMKAILEQVDQAVKNHLQVNAPGIVDSLVKDGKQAVNCEIRKGTRNLLKDVF